MLILFRSFCLLLIFSSALLSADTLVTLHGFMRQGSSMEKMGRAFRAKGYEHVNWDYPSREKTIDEHAEDLCEGLNHIAARRPGEPIHFVTHSLGGIIIRKALNLPGCPIEAKKGRAVLLAPPNQGASLAKFLGKFGAIRVLFKDKAGKQLLTTESFALAGDFPDEMPVLIIAGRGGINPIISSPSDGKVSVWETQLEPHRQLVVFAGHSWIMWHPKVIKAARDFISQK